MAAQPLVALAYHGERRSYTALPHRAIGGYDQSVRRMGHADRFQIAERFWGGSELTLELLCPCNVISSVFARAGGLQSCRGRCVVRNTTANIFIRAQPSPEALDPRWWGRIHEGVDFMGTCKQRAT